MRKQKKQFILLFVVLMVFCGAFFGLRAFNQQQKEQEDAEKQAEKITVVSLKADEITEFSYQKDEKEVSFVKEEGTWYDQNDRTIPIVQTMISTMLSNVEKVTADQEIADVQDVSEYGFDQPENVIRLKMADGKEHTITIGMYNSMTSQYYMMVDEDTRVYLTDGTVYSAFQKSVEDLTEEVESADDDKAEDDTAEEGEATEGDTLEED